MTGQYNVNVYVPTMLIFKEYINKPTDVIEVCESQLVSRLPSHFIPGLHVNTKQQN